MTKASKYYIWREYFIIKKGCPKGAFLGLCEEELIRGVPSGDYTKAVKNKEYGIKAVKILKENNRINVAPKVLWKMITFDGKGHNSQMDIVSELFKRGYIE